MGEPLYELESRINKHNHSVCRVWEDRVELVTECTGGWFPVYENAARVIPFGEISGVVVSKGGVHLIAHHPNCIHFVVRGSRRNVDDMYRDRSFHASDYIKEGVFQLAPQDEADLDRKLETAREIKKYIESRLEEKASRMDPV